MIRTPNNLSPSALPTDLNRDQLAGGAEAYATKGAQYFAGARKDYVDALPLNLSASILEIGCGSGSTGALALANGKCSSYSGLELSAAPALIARQRLSEVIVGDVEILELPWPEASFDALIMSEVLEHLVDPWAVLRRLRRLMKPGALIFASSPNASHHRIVRMLAQGRWDLEEQGAMDRTHLRWFTPSSYKRMFEICGYRIDRLAPLTPLHTKARVLCALMGGWGEHLFTYQINLHGHCD